MEIERPRVRDASKLAFESRIVGKGIARTYALETLVICSFLRGLSVRDVEAALEETFDEPVISKSTVSRVLEDTRERYRIWCKRRLEEHDLVYVYWDAIYLKLRPDDEPAEGVLCAWGITLEGRKVLAALALGSARELRGLARLRARPGGPRDARAGAPGRRRCAGDLEGGPRAVADRGASTLQVHALSNLTSKLPERHHNEVKARYWQILDDAGSAGEAKTGLLALAANYERSYPSAARVITDNDDQLVAGIRTPRRGRPPKALAPLFGPGQLRLRSTVYAVATFSVAASRSCEIAPPRSIRSSTRGNARTSIDIRGSIELTSPLHVSSCRNSLSARCPAGAETPDTCWRHSLP